MTDGQEPMSPTPPATIREWLHAAIADAERRGLPELKPLLEALARSTTALRAADFNGDASGRGHQSPTADHRSPTTDDR
jgi:hypothetical protein